MVLIRFYSKDISMIVRIRTFDPWGLTKGFNILLLKRDKTDP